MDKAPKKKKRMVLKGASAQPIKDGKIVSTVDDILDQITSKLKSEMGKRYRRDAKDGLGFINQIAKIVNAKVTDKKQAKNRLFLKFDNDIENEEMGTVTGPHIAGTGDDSSTVPVSKNAQKKIRKKNRVANIMKLRREATWNQLIKK